MGASIFTMNGRGGSSLKSSPRLLFAGAVAFPQHFFAILNSPPPPTPARPLQGHKAEPLRNKQRVKKRRGSCDLCHHQHHAGRNKSLLVPSSQTPSRRSSVLGSCPFTAPQRSVFALLQLLSSQTCAAPERSIPAAAQCPIPAFLQLLNAPFLPFCN